MEQLQILFTNFEPEETQDCLQYLKDNLDLDVNSQFCGLKELEKRIVRQNPGLVFIDTDSINHELQEIVRKVKCLFSSTQVIAVLHSPAPVEEVSEGEIDDYILKPLRGEKILKSVFRLLTKKKKPLPEVITVWETDRFIVLKPEQIIYCYTVDHKTSIKTTEGTYFSINTLASFEHKLVQHNFFRTHKSFLVNQSYIKEIIPWFNHTYNLVLNYYEHDEVPVSRTYLKEFKQRMGIV